jgi:Protein of unknown function DUF262
MSTQTRDLEEQIAQGRRQISSDSYPMSIGELTNLFREHELVISPAFQRLFRWDLEQKSRLIESILLGIPLPSIFVSQSEDGKWELVDGLQRVSTILQFQGLLVDHSNLVLEGTKYLPSLEGKVWDDEDASICLTDAQRLDFKRSKIDIKIIKRDSSADTKYDLFQRLNSYGSPLQPQEIRNAMLVGVNSEFAEWVTGLAAHPAFVDSLNLPDAQLGEKYNEELVLRFLYLHELNELNTATLRRFNQKLDEASLEMASQYPSSAASRMTVFQETFDLIYSDAGADAFRKWDTQRSSFRGGFLNTAFEVIAIGLGYHVASGTPYRSDVRAAAQELWKRPDMVTRFATGLSTEARMNRMLPLGRDLMAGEPRG